MKHKHAPQWRYIQALITRFICILCFEEKDRVYRCENKNCSLWACEWHVKNDDPHYPKVHIKGVIR